MHCKFNVSSSAFLHQSQAISGLAWSAQSNRILCGPDRLVSSLFFFGFYLWAKCEFRMSSKLLFASLGCTTPRFKAGGAKSALFNPPPPHNIIKIQGGRTVLETEIARYARLRSGTCNPPSRHAEMFSHTARQNQFFGRGGLFVFEPALE